MTRTGYFEPVSTMPEHQRKGLSKTTMFEGLRRLERTRVTLATEAGHSMAAEYELCKPWVKRGL